MHFENNSEFAEPTKTKCLNNSQAAGSRNTHKIYFKNLLKSWKTDVLKNVSITWTLLIYLWTSIILKKCSKKVSSPTQTNTLTWINELNTVNATKCCTTPEPYINSASLSHVWQRCLSATQINHRAKPVTKPWKMFSVYAFPVKIDAHLHTTISEP